MRPTQVLTDEHRVIEQMLGCIERMGDLALAEGKLDGVRAKQAIEFFRHFADHCHHMKEENIFFAELYKRGFSQDEGPIAIMLAEHDQGRAHVKAMDEAIEAAAAGDSDAVKTFAINAAAFDELLKSHIVKEDFILYPMADDTFSEEDDIELIRQFDIAEAGHGDHHKHFTQLAADFGEFYGVERPTEPNQAGLGQVCPAHADMGGGPF